MTKRLSPETIREILVAHNNKVPTSRIAAENNIDASTVRYHIEAFESVYGSSSAVYALVKPVQRVCEHPSLKCLICGVAHDNIHRHELEEITRLNIKLDQARDLLTGYGYSLD